MLKRRMECMALDMEIAVLEKEASTHFIALEKIEIQMSELLAKKQCLSVELPLDTVLQQHKVHFTYLDEPCEAFVPEYRHLAGECNTQTKGLASVAQLLGSVLVAVEGRNKKGKIDAMLCSVNWKQCKSTYCQFCHAQLPKLGRTLKQMSVNRPFVNLERVNKKDFLAI